METNLPDAPQVQDTPEEKWLRNWERWMREGALLKEVA
jgi:hypothetical protein